MSEVIKFQLNTLKKKVMKEKLRQGGVNSQPASCTIFNLGIIFVPLSETVLNFCQFLLYFQS